MLYPPLTYLKPMIRQPIKGSDGCVDPLKSREIGVLLPNNQRERHTCYALCHILYPVSAAHMSIFRMDSNSTSHAQRHAGNTGPKSDPFLQRWPLASPNIGGRLAGVPRS